MPKNIYVIESHEQALKIWRDQHVRNARLLHIDFHCDLRGLLVNRKTQRAFKIWTRFPQLDEGNFLKHAVLEGIITSIRWVHDEPGGRQDDIKSVKYETDLSAQIHRVAVAVRRDKGIPLQYQVMKTEDWNDIGPGEILDIDWDYFAALEYQAESIAGRVDSFLARDFGVIPEQTIVCYSPEYSHPTRAQFQSFVNELAARFDAEVCEIPRPAIEKSTSLLKSTLKPIHQPARQLYHIANLALRRRGIF
jgi:hypothetical protein